MALAIGLTAGAASTSTPVPSSFRWFHRAAPPAGWHHLTPHLGGSVLWYPPALQPISGDPTSVSAAVQNHAGTVLAYLNGGPPSGSEQMSNWASFRIAHLRDELDTSVHEDAVGSRLSFRDATGSCVVDDYVTHVKAHHYVEIACFVRGSHTSGVIVAAALASSWNAYASQIERAVESWQVR
jgi:hypothetical protein